jgi:hypothetical protein
MKIYVSLIEIDDESLAIYGMALDPTHLDESMPVYYLDLNDEESIDELVPNFDDLFNKFKPWTCLKESPNQFGRRGNCFKRVEFIKDEEKKHFELTPKGEIQLYSQSVEYKDGEQIGITYYKYS